MSPFQQISQPHVRAALHRKGRNIPGWLVSLSLHTAICAATIGLLPKLRGGVVGDPAGDLHITGAFIQRSGDGREAVEVAFELPPIEPGRPEKILRVSATSKSPSGAVIPKPAAPAVRQPGQGTGLRGSRGTTSFFGIWESGGKYVYVIDCSGSMYHRNALRAAKRELLSSVNALGRSQQFQIVFYNERQNWLIVPGQTEFRYFAANDANRKLAEQFITQAMPDAGTRHKEALALALRLRPDVLYYLTDGGEPELSTADLAALKQFNAGRTRIHCVRFDAEETGSARGVQAVKQLAAENGGEYVEHTL